jgi:uncharacterized protein (UPF0332 family)
MSKTTRVRPRPKSMALRLLDAAQLLSAEGEVTGAFRRRSVSTAYYAVFHALAKHCADYLTHSASGDSEEYARIYRSLEHGPLRTALSQVQIKKNKTLLNIMEIAAKLQNERHNADYSPPQTGIFPAASVQELLELARLAVDEIEKLQSKSEESRTFAVCLIFKERRP